MIFERARSFSRTTGHEYEDLVSQGNLIYCEAVESFRDDRGAKFSTWLRTMLDRGLYSYTMEASRHRHLIVVEEDDAAVEAENPGFCDDLRTLSDEAREVAEIILHGPEEVAELIRDAAPRIARGLIQRHLRSLGWSTEKQIRPAMSELRAFVLSS